MKESNKTRSKARTAFLIWLVFFTAIIALVALADVDAIRHAAHTPPYWQQLIFAALGAGLLLGLWMFIRWTFASWRNARRLLLGLAILATLIAIAYTEEDWRGKRAWENCKRELEAKGAVLDWNKYVPPTLPDDQNFYTASTNIALRFVKAQTEAQSDAASKLKWLQMGPIDSTLIAEVTLVTNANAVPNNAGLYLRCDHSFVTVGTPHEDFVEPPSSFLSRFDLKDVPLKKAIEQLAKAANVNCTISSSVSSVDSKGKPILVSIGWKNVTARAALYALLDNYDLVLVEDSKTSTAKILSTKYGIYVDPVAVKRIHDVLANVLEQSTNGLQGAVLQGSTGILLCAKTLNPFKPARIVVLANETPNVENIFLGNVVKSMGNNSFHIYGSSSVVSAEDYLKWSDQYVPALDEVREALKRPYAIIPGDYSVPYLQPIPNFVTLRFVAQMLAQRAQCDFLLNRPEDALREVTLMHDMCKILEKPPTGKPLTLVEAMINVAISALYVSTVADGLRLNAWHKEQLVTLQDQCKGINLFSTVHDSFVAEQAASACTIEKTPASKIAELFVLVDVVNDKKPSIWNTIRNPLYLFFKFCPRGWIYQNMVTVVSGIRSEDSVDLTNGTISPQYVKKAFVDLDKSLKHRSPFNIWASIAVPNASKAWQVTAHNQTLVNEGQIVCALERYHLANGFYPQQLDALVPQFMDKVPCDVIGGQPLHYQRNANGKFLLYSVGWNEVDNGGKDSGKDFTKDDWVWNN